MCRTTESRLGEGGFPLFWNLMKTEVMFMNANIDYLGLLNLLRGLRDRGLLSEAETKKFAARLRAELGATVFARL